MADSLSDNIYVDGSQSTDGDGSSSSPYNNLKSALSTAQEGSTIIVKPGIYSGENNVGLTISVSSLTIQADTTGEVIFDGDYTYQIFTIAKVSKNVNIIGLTFTEGNGTKGGAINWKGQSGTIINCKFINNLASYGGAVYFTDNAKSESIVNCTFTNNKAVYRDGGAVYFEDGNGKNSIINSTFNKNTAVRSGGAIRWDDDDGDNTIYNCIFTENSVTGDTSFGGAIHYVCDDLTIEKSTFTNNTGSYGGAVYVNGYDTIITDSRFDGNIAKVAGALYLAGRGATVSNSVFTNNKAGNGSAIYNTVTSTLTDNTFTNNQAESQSLIVFKNNGQYTVTLIGGDNILNAIYNTADLSKITIDNNNPVEGAENSNNGALLYQDSRIAGETVSLRAYDGNNLVNSYTATTDILGNVYLTASGNNLIATHPESNLYTKISTNYSTGNTYTDLFNLINSYILNGVTDIILTQSYTYDSTKDSEFPVNGIVLSESVTINGNGYTLDGNNRVRLFDVEADNVKISNLNIINHINENNGGAIYWNGENGSLTNINFTNNKANGTFGSGGAVYFNKKENTVKDSTFTSNTASLGAAIYINSEGTTISNAKFQSNTGKGTVYINGANTTIDKTNFTSSSDAAIFWSGDNGVLTNSIFTNNDGSTGGAVQWVGDNGKINSNTFTSNTADSMGGAIFASGDSITISSNTFTVNTASSYGGAIYTSSNNGVISTNVFNSNNAGVHGGGIYINANTIVTGNTQNNQNSEYLYIASGEVSTLKVSVRTHETVNQGTSTYLNATVTDDKNNPVSGGTITFNINNEKYTSYQVNNGTAVSLYFAGTSGTFPITADYSNTGNTVTKTNGQLTVISTFYMTITTNGTYNTGSSATVTVNVYDPSSTSPSGSVTIYLNGTAYGTTNAVNGVATFNINLPSTAGVYTLTAAYNDGTGEKSTSRNLVVTSGGNIGPIGPIGPGGNTRPDRNTQTVITVENFTQVETLSNGGNVTGVLKDSNGNPLSGQHVILNLTRTSSGASKLYYATTDYNGEFKLQINLAAGDYTVKATYNGVNNGPMNSYSASTSNTASVKVTKTNVLLNVEDYTSTYPGDGVLNKNFTGTLTNLDGTPLSGQHISLTLTRLSSDASKTYDTVVDYTGTFILQISLAPGNYSVTSSFTQDGTTTTKTTSLTITRV